MTTGWVFYLALNAASEGGWSMSERITEWSDETEFAEQEILKWRNFTNFLLKQNS